MTCLRTKWKSVRELGSVLPAVPCEAANVWNVIPLNSILPLSLMSMSRGWNGQAVSKIPAILPCFVQ
eukprot:2853885-Amphidinium_carterae.1